MRRVTRRSVLLAAVGILLTQSHAAHADPEISWRWIGVKSDPDSSCSAPSNAGWIVEDLFPGVDSRELSRFCLYRRDTAGAIDPHPNPPLDSLDPDLMALSPQGSDLAELTWTALRDNFMSQVGQTALPAGPFHPVRLVVLDSSPTGKTVPGSGPEELSANSPHGPTILNIARDLSCGAEEASCRARLTSRLILAYECFDPVQPRDCRNEEVGGYLGLVSELALAIVREVEAFESQSVEEQLVINLSLGWDSEYGGTESRIDLMPTPVQAVHRALQYAACKGALVVASAGNRGASLGAQFGPILPAYWERFAAPTRLECSQNGITPSPGSASAATYRPLLFSAGGIKEDGSLLDTARVKGTPGLTAFSDHAVVELSDTGGSSGILSGTSVSAVVVSSTAAVLWSYFPGLDAFQIMELIYSSATPLGRDASYCLGGAPCPIPNREQRRVELCQTLFASCSLFPGTCVPSACPAKQELSLSEVDFGEFEGLHEVDMDTLVETLAPIPDCGGEILAYDEGDEEPTDRCPHLQYFGAAVRPWVEPQPASIPCPPCIATYASPGTLYFEVDDSWLGELTSGTLKCGDSTFALGMPALQAQDKAIIRNVPESCLDSFPTFLSFTVDGSRATVIPLRLCQDCT